jgi:hypothetical protein
MTFLNRPAVESSRLTAIAASGKWSSKRAFQTATVGFHEIWLQFLSVGNAIEHFLVHHSQTFFDLTPNIRFAYGDELAIGKKSTAIDIGVPQRSLRIGKDEMHPGIVKWRKRIRFQIEHQEICLEAGFQGTKVMATAHETRAVNRCRSQAGAGV